MDNLQLEGEFSRRSDTVWAPGERASIIRKGDNLQPEGSFARRPDSVWAQGRVIHAIGSIASCRHNNLVRLGMVVY